MQKSLKGDASCCFFKAAYDRMSLNAGIPARIPVCTHSHKAIPIQKSRVTGHSSRSKCGGSRDAKYMLYGFVCV
jgi:hypothetical protein